MSAICGIDWAADWNDVLIADQASGEPLAERRFDHDEAGVTALIELLLTDRVERVAIERPEGLLVRYGLDLATKPGLQPATTNSCPANAGYL